MKTLDLKMPITWDQLTPAQLLYVCRLFLKKLRATEFKLLVFLRLTGVKALPRKIIADQVYYFFRFNKIQFSLSVSELHWFTESAAFLMSDSHLTKNNFQKFTIFGKRFFGPSNKCYNITFLEFLNIEAAIFKFHNSRDNKYLRQLCAILYRPQCKNYNPASPDYNGDRREPFNDFTYQYRARWFRFISPVKAYAVYVFYIGCRNALMAANPELFTGSVVSSDPANPVDNIKKLMMELNLGDITKNKEIQQTLIWEAFEQLNEMTLRAKKIARK